VEYVVDNDHPIPSYHAMFSKPNGWIETPEADAKQGISVDIHD
jgi:hypothetical protein